MSREAELETWARKEIAACGGLMMKWTCPGNRGVPDDICFWYRPTARRGFKCVVDLIEFKTYDPGSELDKLQVLMHKKLIDHGASILIPKCKNDIYQYIQQRVCTT